ncbi:MAG: sterol desaturase family protein [Bryobacterales bacterium]|nr:sterol desaturase family protein [Bryobacterales bacterium]
MEATIGWMFSPSWLPPKDFELLRWLFVPGGGYGFVLVGLALLELLIPQNRRRWTRASLLSGAYLLMAGKLGIYTVAVTPLIRKLWLYFNLPSAHLDRILPLPLYMLVTVLVATFLGYWAHVGLHRIPLLWHIHKIHHSPRNLNCGSVYHKHFLELILHTPAALIASLALGTDLVAPFGIIFILIDFVGHSNVKLNFGKLSYVISTPQVHRIHHSREPRHYDRNFGNQFMIWDHVFGTFCDDVENPPTGLLEEIPESFVKQQILPLAWIARDMGRRVSGLFTSAETPRNRRGESRGSGC